MPQGLGPKVFLSHSSNDKKFVEKLAQQLTEDNFSVWYDDWEIKVGDSIIDKINEGISSSDFLAVALSNSSVNSKWVKEELNSATILSVESKGVFILPILIEKCKIPPLLADKKYANFCEDFDSAYDQLVKAIKEHTESQNDSEETPENQNDLELGSDDPEISSIEEDWLDMLEEGNDVKIKRELIRLSEEIDSYFFEIVESDNENVSEETKKGFWTLIDQITVRVLAQLTHDIENYRIKLVRLLVRAYEKVAGPDPRYVSDWPKLSQAHLWTGIISRVYILGASALKLGNLGAVDELVSVQPNIGNYWASRSWLRHALVMHSRATKSEEGLVAVANGYAHKTKWTHKVFDDNLELILDYLCSFDFLQCLILKHDFYPSFGQFSNYHVYNVVRDLITKKGIFEIRHQQPDMKTFSEIKDEELAKFILDLDQTAAHEYRRFAGWMHGNWPDDIKHFLDGFRNLTNP